MGEYLIGCEFVGELFTPINKSATFFGKTVITALARSNKLAKPAETNDVER